MLIDPNNPGRFETLQGYTDCAMKSMSQARIMQLADQIKKKRRILIGHIIQNPCLREIKYHDSTGRKTYIIGYLNFPDILSTNKEDRDNRLASMYEYAARLVIAGKMAA